MAYRTIMFILSMQVVACSSTLDRESGSEKPCSKESIELIERKVPTGDSQGHGPDFGSSEWYSVVEWRLGIEGDASVPSKGTQQWCDYVISRS